MRASTSPHSMEWTKEQLRDFDLYHNPNWREKIEHENRYKIQAQIEKRGEYRENLFFKHNEYLQRLVNLGLL